MGTTEDKVADEAIHVRGNPLKLGETVGAMFPSFCAVRRLRNSRLPRAGAANWHSG